MEREWIKALLAGFAISLGCIVNLSVGGGAVGAFLFSIGLIAVCAWGLNLFTGKVCYAGIRDVWSILLILVGNLLAAVMMGLLMGIVRPEFVVQTAIMCNAKLDEGLSVITLAILCNVMIFLAVDFWKNNYDKLAGITVIILCVMVFVLSGFEHCIANAFYLSCSGYLFTGNGVLYLGQNILGNALGGILICRVFRMREGLKA